MSCGEHRPPTCQPSRHSKGSETCRAFDSLDDVQDATNFEGERHMGACLQPTPQQREQVTGPVNLTMLFDNCSLRYPILSPLSLICDEGTNKHVGISRFTSADPPTNLGPTWGLNVSSGERSLWMGV